MDHTHSYGTLSAPHVYHHGKKKEPNIQKILQEEKPIENEEKTKENEEKVIENE